MKNMRYLAVAYFIFLLGCVPGPVKFKEPIPPDLPPAPIIRRVEKTIDIEESAVVKNQAEDKRSLEEINDPFGLYRNRREIPNSRNKYEGALWQGESSFGNFMRDSRAQNKGDLVQIKNIQSMVTQFEPPEENQDASGDSVYQLGEKERLVVHTSIEEMSVKIVGVNRRGLLAVYGEKIEYKDSNTTRYKTALRGFIRQEDVNDDNSVDATKIQAFYFKTDRKIRVTKELRNKIIKSVQSKKVLNDPNKGDG